jgi:hypothetical protein
LKINTALQVAKELVPNTFPDESLGDYENFLIHILWNHTDFPTFWNSKDGDQSDIDCLRNQLEEYVNGTETNN